MKLTVALITFLFLSIPAHADNLNESVCPAGWSCIFIPGDPPPTTVTSTTSSYTGTGSQGYSPSEGNSGIWSPAPIETPEPSSLDLEISGLGLLALLGLIRKRRSA